MCAADGHARFLELLALLLCAGAVPAAAAFAALRSLAGALPASGALPQLLDAAAQCADEQPSAAVGGASFSRIPAAGASLLAWLLTRFADAVSVRAWLGTALKRYPGLARHPCLTHVLGGVVPVLADTQQPALAAERALLIDDVLHRCSPDDAADPCAVAAQLAAVATLPLEMCHAANGLAHAALHAHSFKPGAVRIAASALAHLLELVAAGDGEEHWDAAAASIALGITDALAAADHNAETGVMRHASACMLAAALAEGLLSFEGAVVALLPLPLPPADSAAAAAWAHRATLLLGHSEEHGALAAAHAGADAAVLLPLLEAALQARAWPVLHAVAGSVALRRALLATAAWDGAAQHADLLRLLCLGRCLGPEPAASPVAAAADACLRARAPAAVRLSVTEARLRLASAPAGGKSGAHAVLAALAAQPETACMLAACVSALGPAVSAELLQQARTLLASRELLASCERLQATLLELRGDGGAAAPPPAAAPCALERGLALLLHACLEQEHTGAEARHTFCAAVAQQLKAQPEAFKPAAASGAELDAAAAQAAVWLRLRLLLPLLPLVVGQKNGRRCLRETLAAALLHLLALPALRAPPDELAGPHAAAARAAQAEAGESLATRMLHVLHVLLAPVWPAWLPEAQRPSAALAAVSADALLRLQAAADALPLPPDLRARMALLLGSASRAHAAAELAPAAPLCEDEAEQADPWLLGVAGQDGGSADPHRACALLAGAARVRRRTHV
jgi:hypothetical protein